MDCYYGDRLVEAVTRIADALEALNKNLEKGKGEVSK